MTISGIVVRGKQEARTLGYPTANIDYSADQRIESGVWTCFVDLNGERYQGVAVVGMWTLLNGLPSVEVHLLDFTNDVYGLTLNVTFGGRLRELISFDGLEALKKHIQQDIDQAKHWFTTYH